VVAAHRGERDLDVVVLIAAEADPLLGELVVELPGVVARDFHDHVKPDRHERSNLDTGRPRREGRGFSQVA
jgi:hypothetical protein